MFGYIITAAVFLLIGSALGYYTRCKDEEAGR